MTIASEDNPKATVVPARAGPKPKVAKMPAKVNRQVRTHLEGPEQGFGQLWQKTFTVRLKGISQTPAQVMQTWKENFSKFWPSGNYFYEPITGITPGDVALIKTDMAGVVELSTGMLVTQSNAQSFTMMPAQGHVFAGKVNFRTFQDGDTVVAQVRLVARSADPLVEVAMIAFGHEMENEFWQHTLTALARYFGVKAPVITKAYLLDPGVKLSRIRNVVHSPVLQAAFNFLEDPAGVLGFAPRTGLAV